MRHIVLLLILGIGGYFMWQFAGNAARVTATIFLRQHLFKVLAIIGAVVAFFATQAIFGSTKFF